MDFEARIFCTYENCTQHASWGKNVTWKICLYPLAYFETLPSFIINIRYLDKIFRLTKFCACRAKFQESFQLQASLPFCYFFFFSHKYEEMSRFNGHNNVYTVYTIVYLREKRKFFTCEYEEIFLHLIFTP